jgi:hypothetical protein
VAAKDSAGPAPRPARGRPQKGHAEGGSASSAPARQVGEATRGRIEALADGWSRPAPAASAARVAEGSPAPLPVGSPPPPVPEDDETVLASPHAAPVFDAPRPGARARPRATVPRRRGWVGDMRYVFAAWFGVTRARRELLATEAELGRERSARAERLLMVARSAVGDPALELSQVANAREVLVEIEDKRSFHAGRIAGMAQEITRLERALADARAEYRTEVDRHTTEIAALATQLAPFEERALAIDKRLASVARTAESLGEKIKKDERGLVSVHKGKEPIAAIEARLASLRADRDAVRQEEPILAAEQDDLEPRIASLVAARKECERKRAEAEQQDRDDQERVAEKIAAVRAATLVEERAIADADRSRDEVLASLGEHFDLERPSVIVSRLRGVDEHATAIAILERRIVDLQEIVGGIDRFAITRGVLAIVGLVLAAAAAGWAITHWLV